MKLNGIHHITAITADAQANVDFYTRVLGLRMVKKSVNQDDPTVYHLFYGDEHAKPGLDLTFFEYPGAPLGRAGDGMIHRIVWRVGSPAALDFWATRLADEGIESERDGERLRFRDPEGLEHELGVFDVPDEPLIAEHPEVPAEHALQGFHGVRAYGSDPERSRYLLEQGMGFSPRRRRLGDPRREPRRRVRLRLAARRARAAGRRAPSTTSPGARPTRSTRPGARRSARTAVTRPR